ncbi:MAG: hypothetical protein GWN87_23645, partial [Desulfuromonadales bacterium]|nr:hypothetical protein [Desulfuromonadales bacterium]
MSEEHPGRKPLVRAQQEKYAQNIAAGMPKCEAARAAGYSGTGSVAVAKLNKKIHVLERINFLKREAGNAVQVTSSEVVQGILDSIERSKAANQEG